MRITICSRDGKGYFGGPYEWVKRFGPALRNLGVEVSFLFYSDHNAKESTTYNYLKKLGFHCRLLQAHSFSQYRDNTEDRIRWFLEEVKNNPPDIFVPNTVLYAMFAGKWIKEAGIPVIGVLHSDDPAYEFMYDEFIQSNPDFSFSAIVSVSDLLYQRVIANNPNRIPVKTISCGAPLSEKKSHYREKPFKVIYAGKLTDYQKRITETAIALADLVKAVPEIEVEIYGAGSEAEKVRKLVEEKGKGFSIHFKGMISSDKIQEIFAKAQAFVLLSDFEGQPVALMEAMGTGLVPICTNIKSGIPELIEDNVTGLLVNDRGEDFIRTVKRLKESPDLWNLISSNAINKIKQDYSVEATTRKWIDYCKELISESSGKRNVSIPDRIQLPPVNPKLKGADRRKPTMYGYLKNQIFRVLRK